MPRPAGHVFWSRRRSLAATRRLCHHWLPASCSGDVFVFTAGQAARAGQQPHVGKLIGCLVMPVVLARSGQWSSSSRSSRGVPCTFLPIRKARFANEVEHSRVGCAVRLLFKAKLSETEAKFFSRRSEQRDLFRLFCFEMKK
jgi:hypothetical protein